MQPERLLDQDWNTLLQLISRQRCTPFIGPETYLGNMPFSAQIARAWTAQYPDFPFTDASNLTQAAQYLAVMTDAANTKDLIVEQFEHLTPPNFTALDEPHRVLAGLPLPVYITTNYDDFMVQALRRLHKNPRRELCPWNDPTGDWTESSEPSLYNKGYVPDVPNPVVFHLFGYSDRNRADSLVLSEDDYLDFLVNVSKYPTLIPAQLHKIFTGTSLLLMGYRLDDWNFRIMFRTVASFLQANRYKVHIAVQLVPGGDETPAEQKAKAQKFFNRYLERHDIRVYWGTCQDFITELKTRWEASDYGR